MNSKRILNLIISNWPVKALSLGAALFLFFFHRVSTLETRTLAVPLRIENAGGMVATNNYPKTIRVTFRGDRKLMDPITENDVEAFLDLLYCNTPGSYTIPVGLVKKGNALDIDPLEIICEPQEIRIVLDELASKTIPVKTVVSGSTAEGYELTQTRISPQTVMASGPISMLVKTPEFFTESAKLDGHSETFTTTLKIINNEPLIELTGGRTVEFTAEIHPVIPSKLYENVPFMLINLSAGLTANIRTPSAAVLVRAQNRAQLEALTTEHIGALLDASEITEAGIYRLQPHLEIGSANTGENGAPSEGLAKEPAQQPYTVVSVSPEFAEVEITQP
ncbi:MAG: hypothetical protein LBG72_04155 [Spirochaetaceae bacterium]|nr:hypothetical protein [Spirochaetaceae bacterium]